MTQTGEVTLFLIEDDKVDQEGIRRALKRLKILNPLVIAEDGLEALEILRGKGRTKLKRPYVVLLDLNMPRMNGHEFLKELRKDKKLKDTVVFVLTTSSDEEDLVAAYDKNVAGYIVKGQMADGFLKAITMLDTYWRVVVLPNGKQ